MFERSELSATRGRGWYAARPPATVWDRSAVRQSRTMSVRVDHRLIVVSVTLGDARLAVYWLPG